MMRFASALILFFLLSLNVAYCQSEYNQSDRINFISLETGFMNDGYHSLGFRLFGEYRRCFSDHWSGGISSDNSFHFTQFPIVDPAEGVSHQLSLPSNLNILSVNGYYNLPFRNGQFYLRPGVGVSAVMVRWEDNQEVGFAVNFNLPLGIRVSENVYITTSILPIIIPFNRLYISDMNLESFAKFHAFTLLPIGVDIRF